MEREAGSFGGDAARRARRRARHVAAFAVTVGGAAALVHLPGVPADARELEREWVAWLASQR